MKTGTKTLTLALAVLATLAGCKVKTANDASLELYAVCAPPDAEKCGTQGKCDSMLAVRPWVATRRAGNSTQNALRLFIQVNNQLKNNEDLSVGRLNTHDVTIDEFRFKYTSDPPLSLPEFTFPQNQLVPANGSATPVVTVIPAEVMKLIDAKDLSMKWPSGTVAVNARVSAEVVAVGHTRDGQTIESEPWAIPVDVYDVDVQPGATLPVSFDLGCAKAGEVVVAICPGPDAQTASVKCATP